MPETAEEFLVRVLEGVRNSNRTAEDLAAWLHAVSKVDLKGTLENFVGFTECNVRHSEYGDGYEMTEEIKTAEELIAAWNQ